jgi:hypothetical protein
MDRARRAFVERVVWTGGGTPREFLLDSGFYVNAALAPIYGVTGVKGDTLQAMTMNSAQRFGLLTHADFLAKTGKGNDSMPPRRGRAIWQNLLCGDIPMGLPPVPPEIMRDPMDTTHEHFQKKVEPIACASACHAILDNAGYAFENFGGPVWRDKDPNNGKPIDATGSLKMPFGGTLTYAGPRPFVEGVAASEELKQCLTRQFFRMAVGRDETVADEAALKAAYDAFEGAREDVKALALAVVSAKGFSSRRINPGEVAQ